MLAFIAIALCVTLVQSQGLHYTIQSREVNTLCMAQTNAGIVPVTCSISNQNYFIFNDLGEGKWEIKNSATNQCLYSNFDRRMGMYTCDRGQSDQKFYLHGRGEGFNGIVGVNSGRCLNLTPNRITFEDCRGVSNPWEILKLQTNCPYNGKFALLRPPGPRSLTGPGNFLSFSSRTSTPLVLGGDSGQMAVFQCFANDDGFVQLREMTTGDFLAHGNYELYLGPHSNAQEFKWKFTPTMAVGWHKLYASYNFANHFVGLSDNSNRPTIRTSPDETGISFVVVPLDYQTAYVPTPNVNTVVKIRGYFNGGNWGGCMGAKDQSHDNNVPMVMGGCDWRLASQNLRLDEKNRLVLQHSNKCVDVYVTKVQQWDCHDGDNQKWTIDAKGRIRPFFDPSKCIHNRGMGDLFLANCDEDWDKRFIMSFS